MVKPFSAGGLVYGQIGAKYAGKACVEALKTKDFSERFLLAKFPVIRARPKPVHSTSILALSSAGSCPGAQPRP